jgi:hypothetical protein
MSEQITYVPFEILMPGMATRTILVPVRTEHGQKIMTVEAHELIDKTKMQMVLSRLNEAALKKAPVLEARVNALEKLVIELYLIAMSSEHVSQHSKGHLDKLIWELEFAGEVIPTTPPPL